MTRERESFEKALQRHLRLFGSPSASQLEASRTRIRERLRTGQQPDVSIGRNEKASTTRYTWRTSLALAAAAAGIALVVATPWRNSDWLATVEAADGSHYSLAANTVLRSPDTTGSMLTLKDGSRVEMRSQSELTLERATDGIGIRLRSGGIVVDAVSREGLYVYTKDMTVAVSTAVATDATTNETIVVNAEDSGSRVTVVEGEVRVRDGRTEKTVRPGEQVSTTPALAARTVREEVGWSRAADRILAAFEKGMLETGSPIEPSAASVRAFAGTARQAAEPEFEEASIRQCDSDNLPATPAGARGGGANSMQMTPGRLNALCMTLATLIRVSYGYSPMQLDFNRNGRVNGLEVGLVYGMGVEDGQRVRGGPDWLRSERYTVEAVAGAGKSPNAAAMSGPMLRQLLERRLLLKAHIETEQIPAFALTVARGGPKNMKKSTSADCEQLQGRPGQPLLFGYPANVLELPRQVDAVRRGEKPSCGMWGHRNGPNQVFIGGDVPIEALVMFLGNQLGGVRVIDKTGLTDRFNSVLEIAIDENTPGFGQSRGPLPPFMQELASRNVPRAATVFTALEEQLGLHLERAQAPREFIVIDRVERPSPN